MLCPEAAHQSVLASGYLLDALSEQREMNRAGVSDLSSESWRATIQTVRATKLIRAKISFLLRHARAW